MLPHPSGVPRRRILWIVFGLRRRSCSAIQLCMSRFSCLRVGACAQSATAASLAQELAGTGAGFKVPTCGFAGATHLPAHLQDRCLVFNVTGGAAAEWNKGHPDKALQAFVPVGASLRASITAWILTAAMQRALSPKVGDCIAAANGVKGSSKAVFESIRKADKARRAIQKHACTYRMASNHDMC